MATKNLNDNSVETDVDPSLFILNENNVWITTEYIEGMLKNYNVDIKISDINPFKKAMVHTSYLVRDENYYSTNKFKHTLDLEPIEDPSKAIPLQKESYERLEYLGDSVIHLILAMTRLRTKIENGETLALLNQAVKLDKYVIISRFIERNDGRDNNHSILEDAFEAFMGALYLDAGFNVCRDFFVNLVEKEVDFAAILHTETNFKDILLQYFHQCRWREPIYGDLDVSGPDHKKMYTMYVKCRKHHHDDGEIVGIGVGSSKKKGEQEAARHALIHFGMLKDDDSDSESYEECSSNSSEDLSELSSLSSLSSDDSDSDSS
jgi:dsRNA-specific ribonuclease